MRTALGFTVKSGWTCAVALSGAVASPHVVDSRRIELSDPSDLQARQPYHASAGKARPPGSELDRLVTSVHRFGGRSVAAFVDEQRTGHTVQAAGIVVGSLIDPSRIGNEHIRIHALEGQLFREVLTDAIERTGLSTTVWRERDLYEVASGRFGRPAETIRGALANLGRNVDGPWRAEHKLAALAAWLVLGDALRQT